MGYTTTFEDHVTVTPPLNAEEISYLKDFATTRRMDRAEGPYFVLGPGYYGQDATPGVRDHNRPPAGQPGLWCQWVPTEDGAGIEWDGREKFYDAAEWMGFLIDHFLKPGAVASRDLRGSIKQDERLEFFTFDHLVEGTIYAEGEESGDLWAIKVVANDVSVHQGVVTYKRLDA